MKIVIASRNGYKIRETKLILKKFPEFDIFSLLDFPDYPTIKHKGNSVKDLAINKALHTAQALNHWVIADESVLIVPSLNGEPGILSDCYAGDKSSEKENRKKLLQMMQLLDGTVCRSGYFECCMILASPQGDIRVTRGTCEGYISEEEKGGGGFGYDPIFLKYDYKLTFAELSEDIKNKISHRSKALKKLLPELESLASTCKIQFVQ